jgi:hypothetical protein
MPNTVNNTVPHTHERPLRGGEFVHSNVASWPLASGCPSRYPSFDLFRWEREARRPALMLVPVPAIQLEELIHELSSATSGRIC